MNSNEIFETIKELNNSIREIYTININGYYVPVRKDQVFKILQEQYSEARRTEFKSWLKSNDVKAQDIAEKLGISTIQFSQLLAGSIKSNKTTGDTVEFIAKCEKIASELC